MAGWSSVGLAWEGVPFADVYRLLIEPALAEEARVRFLVFVGLDGYRSIVTLEDSLADEVLIADRLDGRPLTPEHGAPVRLVSPDQYGFVSTKHLCRIELHPFSMADGPTLQVTASIGVATFPAPRVATVEDLRQD